MKNKLAILSIFILLILLTGCKPSAPTVVVTNYPVEYLVKQIGQDYVTVTNISQDTLIQRAKINENYKKVLKESNVLFYIGGLEPYMELYLDDIRSSRITMVDLS